MQTNHPIATNRNRDRWTIVERRSIPLAEGWMTLQSHHIINTIRRSQSQLAFASSTMVRTTSKSNPRPPPLTPKTMCIMDSRKASVKMPPSTSVDHSTAPPMMKHHLLMCRRFHYENVSSFSCNINSRCHKCNFLIGKKLQSPCYPSQFPLPFPSQNSWPWHESKINTVNLEEWSPIQ